jgi:CheY-like chemotaxis protein
VNNTEHLLPPNRDQIVVMVVDDEVLVRNVARIVLELEGYFILTAGNGEEALEISRQYPGIIHAILSDVQMPRMDGLELRDRILTERSGIKVLLMSGYMTATAENIQFLQKPFGPTVLKGRIQQLLASA